MTIYSEVKNDRVCYHKSIMPYERSHKRKFPTTPLVLLPAVSPVVLLVILPAVSPVGLLVILPVVLLTVVPTSFWHACSTLCYLSAPWHSFVYFINMTCLLIACGLVTSHEGDL